MKSKTNNDNDDSERKKWGPRSESVLKKLENVEMKTDREQWDSRPGSVINYLQNAPLEVEKESSKTVTISKDKSLIDKVELSEDDKNDDDDNDNDDNDYDNDNENIADRLATGKFDVSAKLLKTCSCPDLHELHTRNLKDEDSKNQEEENVSSVYKSLENLDDDDDDDEGNNNSNQDDDEDENKASSGLDTTLTSDKEG